MKHRFAMSILDGFYTGFNEINRRLKIDSKNFFFNSVIGETSDSLIDYKEKLYNILIYSEIPEKEAKSLTEKTFLKKDLSIIICHYKQILEELNSIESSV